MNIRITLLVILIVVMIISLVLSIAFRIRGLFEIVLGSTLAVVGSAIIFLFNSLEQASNNELIKKNLLQDLILEIKQNKNMIKDALYLYNGSETKELEAYRRDMKIKMGCLSNHMEPNFFKYYTFSENNLYFYKSYISFINKLDYYWNVFSLNSEFKKMLILFEEILRRFGDGFDKIYSQGNFNKDVAIDYEILKKTEFESYGEMLKK